MTRRLCALAVLAALLLATGGCGKDAEQDYCRALEGDQETFSEMQGDASGIALLEHLPLLRRLAEAAPADLSDEWQVLLGALDSFSQTLDAVGVAPGDFVAGQPPTGLSAADRERVANAANALASDDVVAAANGIEQQAKDVCKVQLGL